MSTGDYFYRFIQDAVPPQYSSLREKLERAAAGYQLDDSSVNGEVTDQDSENPARHPFVDYMVQAEGLDPSDPFSVAKSSPAKKLTHIDVDGLSPADIAALAQVRKSIDGTFTKELLAKYIPDVTTAGDGAASKFRFIADNKYGFAGAPRLVGGVSYTGHLSNTIAVMRRAQLDGGSLDIGLYQLEHPTVISEILNVQDKVQTRLRLSTPFGLGAAAELGSAYVRANMQVLGGDINMWDHFKFFGANLDKSDETSVFMITSANATRAAMGYQDYRRSALGTNLESSFVLDKSMVDSGQVTQRVFDSLIKQARSARDWVMTDAPIPAGDFRAGMGPSEITHSRLLGTGQTWGEHQRLLKEVATRGGTVRIMNFEIGDLYARNLADVIRAGGNVEIIHGVAHTASGSSETLTDKALRNLRATLVQELGEEAVNAQLRTVRSPSFVHAKMAFYEIGGVEEWMFLGSTNLTKGTLLGTHGDWYNPETGKVEGPYGRKAGESLISRDLDVMLTNVEGEYDVTRERKRYESIFFGMSLFKRSPVLRGWAADQTNKLKQALEERTAAKDRFASLDLVKTTPLFDPSNGELYGTKITIGGKYGGVTLNDIYSFTLLQKKTINEGGTAYVDAMGQPSQIYIPELSKSIGPVMGISEAGTGFGTKEYDAYQTIAAGISRMNFYISKVVEEFSAYTTYDVNDLRRSGYIRGRFRQSVKESFRRTFANFEGIEMGVPVYNAKSFSRLAFGIVQDLGYSSPLLSLHDTHIPHLDTANIEISTSQAFMGYVEEVSGGRNLADLTAYELENYPFLYRTGGLVKNKTIPGPGGLGQRATSAARTFGLPGFARSLSISAHFEGQEGQPDEYFFALPISKIIQLSQRLGNIMSARALLTPEGAQTKSLLAGQDGKVVEGMKVKGYMALGLGGDIAYFDSGTLPTDKFGLPYRKEIKSRYYTINPESLDLVKRQLERLIDPAHPRAGHLGVPLARRIEGTNKYEIFEAGLDLIKHHIPVFETLHEGLGRNVTQMLELPTSKYVGASPSMIIDLDTMSAGFRDGMFVMELGGETRWHLQTGSRIMIGIKDPLIFIEPNSPLFTRMGELAGNVDSRWSGANLIFGSSGVKTGEILLQTGLELIRSGQASELLTDQAIDRLFSTKTNYLGLFERFDRFLDAGTRSIIQNIKYAADPLTRRSEIKRLFEYTADVIARNNKVTTGDVKGISSAFLAFGLHATDFLDKLRAQGDGTLPPGFTDFIPVLGVAPIAANATVMSSRDRVNFLNYHAGQYTDAFMDMMALDPRVQSRSKAFTEILGAGMLGVSNYSEVLVGGVDVSPMTGYITSLQKQYIDLVKATRALEGKSGTINPVKLLEDLDKLKRDIQSQQTYTSIAGNYEAGYIRSYLEAEKAAGIGARTLLIPELGKWSSGPLGRRFVFDATAKTASIREVTLISPDSLLAIGSFDDYAHEVAKLQVELLERLPNLLDIFPGGRVRPIGGSHKRTYDDIMGLVGRLEEAQAAMAATDFQKMLGGQLAVSGFNMIVGTHDELKPGYMVLGEEPFKRLKAGAVADAMDRIEGKAERFKVAAELAERYNIEAPARVRVLQTRIAEEQALAATTATDLRALNRVAAPARIAKLQETLINAYGDRYLKYVLEALIDNQETRHIFMPGTYQRAGAPMGPLGITGATIITGEEFRAMTPDMWAPLDMARFRTSVLLSYGGMMFNLGDFDGDTMSVSRISRYAGAAMLDVLGKLGTEEKALFEETRLMANMDVRERGIIFAREYIGGSPLFNENDLYRATSDHMRSMDLEKRKQYLRGLKTAGRTQFESYELADLHEFESRLESGYKLATGAVSFAKDIYGVTVDIEASVAAQLRDPRNIGADYDTLFEQTLRGKTQEGRAIFDSYLDKVSATLSDSKLPIEAAKLTDKEVMALISASAWAAGPLIGKVFETSFAIQTYFGAERGSLAGSVANRLQAFGYQSDLHRNAIRMAANDNTPEVKALLDEYKLGNATFEKIQTLVLLAQQMARDAIKPKLDLGAINAIREASLTADSFSSGILFAKNQPRTRALEALRVLVDGRTLDTPSQKMVHLNDEQYYQLYKDLHEGFQSYLADQAEGIFARGGTSAEYIQGLLTKNTATGWSLMTAEDVKEAVKSAQRLRIGAAKTEAEREELVRTLQTNADHIAEIFNPDGSINTEAANRLSPDHAKLIIEAHLNKQAGEFSVLAMSELYNPDIADYRRSYLNYATAVSGATPGEFYEKVSTIDPATKLKIFAGLTSRGKIRASAGMMAALQDILLDWSSAADIKVAAIQATDSGAFADNLENIYKLFEQKGNLKSALSTVLGSASTRPLEIEDQIASVESEQKLRKQTRDEAQEKQLQELEKLNKGRDLDTLKAERDRWRSLNEIRSMLGIRQFSRDHNYTVLETMQAYLETKAGQHLDIATKGALGIAIAGIALGMNTPEVQAQTLAGAVSMAAPMNLARSVAHDGMVHASIVAISGATAMGAHLVTTRATQPMLGDHGASLAGGVAAAAVGMGVGLLLEAMARKYHMIESVNPIPQAISRLMDTAVEEFTEAAMGTDEIEEEAGFSTEDTVVWDATGETLGFWPQDAEDGAQDYVEPDMDMSISTYDETNIDQGGFTNIREYFNNPADQP